MDTRERMYGHENNGVIGACSMSSKVFAEKREIEMSVRRTVCDACGNVVKEGSTRIRLYVDREVPSSEYAIGKFSKLGSNQEAVDVCTTDCLKGNLSGLVLLLQSKLIPECDTGRENPNETVTEAPSPDRF